MRKLIALLLITLLAMTSVALAQDNEDFTVMDGLISVTLPDDWSGEEEDNGFSLEYITDIDGAEYRVSLLAAAFNNEMLTLMALGAEADTAEVVHWFDELLQADMASNTEIMLEIGELQEVALGDNTLTFVDYVLSSEADDEQISIILGVLTVDDYRLLVLMYYGNLSESTVEGTETVKNEAFDVLGTVQFTREFDGRLPYTSEMGINFDRPVNWRVTSDFEDELWLESSYEVAEQEYMMEIKLSLVTADWLEQLGLEADMPGSEIITALHDDPGLLYPNDTFEILSDIETTNAGDLSFPAFSLEFTDDLETSHITVGWLELGEAAFLVEMEYQAFPFTDDLQDIFTEHALGIIASFEME